MRERVPISDDPTNAEIVRHIDQLHNCLDNALDQMADGRLRYEALAQEQRADRHASRDRDQVMLGGLTVLLRERGYEIEVDDAGAAKAIRAPAPKSLWERLSPPATVLGAALGALGALGAYKGLAAVLGLFLRALLHAH